MSRGVDQLVLEQQEERARQMAKQGWQAKAQEKLWNDELDFEASISIRRVVSSAALKKKSSQGICAFLLTDWIVMQINADQYGRDKSIRQKIESNQHKRPEDFPGLVHLLPVLSLPHRKCHQRVRQYMQNLVFQRKTPEGDDVEAGIENDE